MTSRSQNREPPEPSDSQFPVLLTQLADLPEGGGREFAVESENGSIRIVLVRQGSEVYAYENRCPHFHIPLNFEPDQFCIYGRDTLMCAHHSAMFTIADGYCFDGPCKGSRLRAISLTIKDGLIFAT